VSSYRYCTECDDETSWNISDPDKDADYAFCVDMNNCPTGFNQGTETDPRCDYPEDNSIAFSYNFNAPKEEFENGSGGDNSAELHIDAPSGIVSKNRGVHFDPDSDGFLDILEDPITSHTMSLHSWILIKDFIPNETIPNRERY
jgi:hypothetical protein